MKFFNKLFKKEAKQEVVIVLPEVIENAVEPIEEEPVFVKEKKPEWVTLLEEMGERIEESNRKNLIQLNQLQRNMDLLHEGLQLEQEALKRQALDCAHCPHKGKDGVCKKLEEIFGHELVMSEDSKCVCSNEFSFKEKEE